MIGVLVGLIWIICCGIIYCRGGTFVCGWCASRYLSRPLRECRERLNESRHDRIVGHGISLHRTSFTNSSFFRRFVFAFETPETHNLRYTRDVVVVIEKRLKVRRAIARKIGGLLCLWDLCKEGRGGWRRPFYKTGEKKSRFGMLLAICVRGIIDDPKRKVPSTALMTRTVTTKTEINFSFRETKSPGVSQPCNLNLLPSLLSKTERSSYKSWTCFQCLRFLAGKGLRGVRQTLIFGAWISPSGS